LINVTHFRALLLTTDIIDRARRRFKLGSRGSVAAHLRTAQLLEYGWEYGVVSVRYIRPPHVA
jgi:hypothetical protein